MTDWRINTRHGTWDIDTRHAPHIGGVPANNARLAHLALLAWTSLLSDSPLLPNKGQKPLRLFKHFYAEGLEDLPQLIRDYAALGDLLMKALQRAETTLDLQAYNRTPVFKEVLEFTRTRDPYILRYLLSFFFFLKKAEFDMPEFAEAALCGWQEVERTLKLSPPNPDIALQIKEILRQALPDFADLQTYAGKHGPGAVYGDERGWIEKTHQLSLSPKLRRFFGDFSPAMGCISPESREFIRTLFTDEDAQHDVSRLMFVPKNYKTYRSICMEPTPVMFAQQHAMQILYTAINNSIIGRSVRLSDQGWNQAGALCGSASGNVDTVDLSAASDSVHHSLVSCFPRAYRHMLLSTRTSFVELPNGQVIKPVKFAPMGSAVCFPVESILFWACSILAILWHHYGSRVRVEQVDVNAFVREMISTRWRSEPVLEWRYHSITSDLRLYNALAVYGDDIVIDSYVTPHLLVILGALGFRVNVSKSFLKDDAVRESCGIYAFMGVDVTPYLFKMRYFLAGMGPRELQSFIGLVNRAGDYGYQNLHRCLINYIKRGRHFQGKYRLPVLFSEKREKELAIYTKAPSNRHLRSRESHDLHRTEYRVLVPRFSTVDPSGDRTERYMYHMWTRSRLYGDGTDDSGPMKLKHPSGYRWRWTPIY